MQTGESMTDLRPVADVCALLTGLRDAARETPDGREWADQATAWLRALDHVQAMPAYIHERLTTYGPIRTLADVTQALRRLAVLAADYGHTALRDELFGAADVCVSGSTAEELAAVADALGVDVDGAKARAETTQNVTEAFEDVFGANRNPWDDLRPVETLWTAWRAAAGQTGDTWDKYCARLVDAEERAGTAEAALEDAQEEIRDLKAQLAARVVDPEDVEDLKQQVAEHEARAAKAHELAYQLAELLRELP